MNPFSTKPPVYVWSNQFPDYGRRMEAITAYTWAAYELGTEFALVPKEVTNRPSTGLMMAKNVPFRCF